MALPTLGKGADLIFPLGLERASALGDRGHLGAEPCRLLIELADLNAELFAALDEPLGLALHLLDVLPEVVEAELGLLDEGVVRGLTGRERRDLDLSLSRLAAEGLHLPCQQLVTRGQGGEVRR